MLWQIISSLRLALFTMLVCCVAYPLAIFAFANGVVKERAEASLVRDYKGNFVGSSLIAQNFSSPKYFWPRPSAVDYNALAAGGSNLSPANPKLRDRAIETIAKFKLADGAKIPADLVAASGSGLDPHISLASALLQAERVASARGLQANAVLRLIEKTAERPGGILSSGSVVNVLLLNLELDNLRS